MARISAAEARLKKNEKVAYSFYLQLPRYVLCCFLWLDNLSLLGY